MQGVLFRYSLMPAHVAFFSGPTTARRHVVLIAGMTEGLDALPYTHALRDAIADRGYALVQAQLKSSYDGWGVGSLTEDAKDLAMLLYRLAKGAPADEEDPKPRAEGSEGHFARSEGVVLMGHSTGAQIAVRFAKLFDAAKRPERGLPPLLGIVLQAPVSDREWLHDAHTSLTDRLDDAQALCMLRREDDIACRAPGALYSAPVSARRLVALVARLGDDDMFSTWVVRGAAIVQISILYPDTIYLHTNHSQTLTVHPSPQPLPHQGPHPRRAVQAARPPGADAAAAAAVRQ
jgi:hypothetical protein